LPLRRAVAGAMALKRDQFNGGEWNSAPQFANSAYNLVAPCDPVVRDRGLIRLPLTDHAGWGKHN